MLIDEVIHVKNYNIYSRHNFLLFDLFKEFHE